MFSAAVIWAHVGAIRIESAEDIASSAGMGDEL
jgi:hypothetical protein